MIALAEKSIAYCREIAGFTEEPGRTTRTFLSPPMRKVHKLLGDWMRKLGMTVWVDAAGNLRGLRGTARKRLIVASHLDTVPNAGAFDGILGVVLGVALIEGLGQRCPDLAIEVIGFSEEEGVRFGMPFIGSKALVGSLQPDTQITEAIKAFGLDPADLPLAVLSPDAIAYLEFHIEQGPVLEATNLPVGVVESIAGQSRFKVTFTGKANHAGTTPMSLRKDALAAAAEWIHKVEQVALNEKGLVATCGWINAEPNASNVVPGITRVTLDVRHADDQIRNRAVQTIFDSATRIGARRGIAFEYEQKLDQTAVPMDPALTQLLSEAAGNPPRMISGAGHDAMILAPLLPTTMLFLRSPGGISHDPDESVSVDDVAQALTCGIRFIEMLEAAHV
jgi:allantoate deiminase